MKFYYCNTEVDGLTRGAVNFCVAVVELHVLVAASHFDGVAGRGIDLQRTRTTELQTLGGVDGGGVATAHGYTVGAFTLDVEFVAGVLDTYCMGVGLVVCVVDIDVLHVERLG